MRLLLINPRFPESFWSSKWALAEVLPNKRTMNPPLGLATLAALCPPHWEVEIVDENIEPIPLEPQVPNHYTTRPGWWPSPTPRRRASIS